MLKLDNDDEEEVVVRVSSTQNIFNKAAAIVAYVVKTEKNATVKMPLACGTLMKISQPKLASVRLKTSGEDLTLTQKGPFEAVMVTAFYFLISA